MYDPDFVGEWSIWSRYGPADQYPPEVVQHIRAQYAGKVTMLDRWMGLVLDRMDRYGLWDNTLLLVTSDHGHHLGEHGFLGKNQPPLYRHLANIPLFLSLPGMTRQPGSRGPWLTSQIDVYPSVAEALGLSIPEDYTIHGTSLLPLLRGETESVRETAHTAYFGFPAAITDGRWILHKQPVRADNAPLYRYGINLEAFHRRAKGPYVEAETGRFLPHTDAIVYRVPVRGKASFEWDEIGKEGPEDLLFDLGVGEDDSQNQIDAHPEVAERLAAALVAEYQRIQVPDEQFERLGLTKP
jgi:arylsulfatase A-like enzyme